MSHEAKDALVNELEDVIKLQHVLPGLLTGLYLDSDGLLLLSDTLSNENPVPNSIGSYFGYPVYDREFLAIALNKLHGEYQGVVYTYVPMHSVD